MPRLSDAVLAAGLTTSAIVGGAVGYEFQAVNNSVGATELGVAEQAASDANIAYMDITDGDMCLRGVFVALREEADRRSDSRVIKVQPVETFAGALASCLADGESAEGLADQAEAAQGGLVKYEKATNKLPGLRDRTVLDTREKIYGILAGTAIGPTAAVLGIFGIVIASAEIQSFKDRRLKRAKINDHIDKLFP